MRLRNINEIKNALKRLAPKIEEKFEKKLFEVYGEDFVKLFQMAMDVAIYSFEVPEDKSHPYFRTQALRDSVAVSLDEKGVLVYVDSDKFFSLVEERAPEFNSSREPKGMWPYYVYVSGKNGAPVSPYSGEGYYNEAYTIILDFIASELIHSGDFKL